MPDEPPPPTPEVDDGSPWGGYEEEGGEPRVPWEVPEVAAVVVLVAVGLLILGGLGTGIAATIGSTVPIGAGAGTEVTGESIAFGTTWAGPLLAMVLLAVLGLCWWQVHGWAEVSAEVEHHEASTHVLRGQRLAWWAKGALVLTLAGSFASLAGTMLTNSAAVAEPALIWSRDIYDVASVLAVAVIASGGVWIGTRLHPATDDDTGTASPTTTPV